MSPISLELWTLRRMDVVGRGREDEKERAVRTEERKVTVKSEVLLCMCVLFS